MSEENVETLKRGFSVLRFPEPPSDPAQWPESWWGDGHDEDEWIRVPRGRWL